MFPGEQDYLMRIDADFRHINKKMENKLNKIKENILTKLKKIPEVKAVYLFGSYANRKEKPISDVDICVITERGITKFKKLEILSYAWKNIDISIFWDLPIAIKSKVLKEGIELFCRDNKFLSTVMVSTMKEYLDFDPVLKKFTRLYLGG